MPAEEKKAAHDALYSHVMSHTGSFWANTFRKSLEQVANSMQSRYKINLPHITEARVPEKYTIARGRRLLLFNYDGTLAPHAANFASEKLDLALVVIIKKLVEDPRNIVYICSGRSKSSLDNLFGEFKGIGLR